MNPSSLTAELFTTHLH